MSVSDSKAEKETVESFFLCQGLKVDGSPCRAYRCTKGDSLFCRLHQYQSRENYAVEDVLCRGVRKDGNHCMNYPSKRGNPRFCYQHQEQAVEDDKSGAGKETEIQKEPKNGNMHLETISRIEKRVKEIKIANTYVK